MSALFFDSWEVKTRGIATLLNDLPDDTEVWRGADGSYAAGRGDDICAADPCADADLYEYSGTAAEYKN